MRGWTHIAFALALALLADRLNSFPLLFYPIIMFFAIFPDIDYAGSLLGRNAKAVGFIAGHRTVFHSLWMAAACAILAYLIAPWLTIPVALGYLSHLALDALTHTGISWLYPFGRTKGFVKTGGIVEWVVFLVFLAMDGLFVAVRFKLT